MKSIKEDLLDNLILDFNEIDEKIIERELALKKKLKEKKSPTTIQIFSINEESDR